MRFYFLKEDEQLILETWTSRYSVEGPRVFFKPWLHRVRERRTGWTLEPTDYVRVRDTLTGEVRVEVGPQLFFLGATEELERQGQAIALERDQYVRLLDNLTGRIRVIRGEALVVPEATEQILGEVSDGIVVDDDQAVLVRSRSTGELTLITEPQMFFPSEDQDLVEVRRKIRLADHEVVVVRDRSGQYRFYQGAGKGRAFFLDPYCEVVEFCWASGIHKERNGLKVTRLDVRPKFMWYEFDVRTKDNVELVVGVTFFWQIVDVARMVQATDDAPGDLCSHARSRIIQSVSQVTLEQFLDGFNDIVLRAVLESGDPFYAERGLTIHSVEVRQIGCKDAETQHTLMEIIQETTNRLNRLQKQQSENEVSVQKVRGEIDAEQLRGELIELRRRHSLLEADAQGEGEARRILTFLSSLDGQVSLDEKIRLFRELRLQERVAALAAGNARLFITPKEAALHVDATG